MCRRSCRPRHCQVLVRWRQGCRRAGPRGDRTGAPLHGQGRGRVRERQRDENTGDQGRRRGLGFRRVGRSAGVQEKREIGSRLTLRHVGLVPRSRWGALLCRNQPSQSSSLVKHTNVIPLSCSMFMPSHFTHENSLVYLLTLPTIKSIYS